MMVRQDLSAGEWQLVIKDVRFSDAGQYECQINTSPVLSHTLKLAVVGEYSSPQGVITCQYFIPIHGSSRVESAYIISGFKVIILSIKALNNSTISRFFYLNSLNRFSIVHSMNNE